MRGVVIRTRRKRLKMVRTHKIELVLNNKQRTHLGKTAGCNRFAYNWMLARHNENYKTGKKSTILDVKKEFNAFKKSLEWMSEVNAHAVANDANERLRKAFDNFFAKRAKFPKFKKKHDGDMSFSLAGSEIKIKDKALYICKLGWMKLTEELRYKDLTKLYRITMRERAGRWFCSFTCEIPDDRRCENQTEAVGVDVGVKELATCSDGKVYENPKATKSYSKKIRVLSKRLSRRKKGGKNWLKTKDCLRIAHYTISNVRSDATHKATTEICRKFGIVCLEDMNVKGMVKNHKLAKPISDANFGELRRLVEYKALSTLFIGRFEPSSKTCHRCGQIKKNLTLADRVYECECGLAMDRDLNAAINIRNFAVSSTGSKKPTALQALAATPQGLR